MEESQVRFVLYAAFVKDIPRAFIYKTPSYEYLSGPYGETLKYFAIYKNLELNYTLIDDFANVTSIYEDIRNGIYNMSTYSDLYYETRGKVRHSYPTEWMQKCIVVPYGEEIPKYLNIIWPYGYVIWLMIFLGSIYIGILMRLVTGFNRDGKLSEQSQSCIRNIPHALNISLYTMNMGIRANNSHIRVQIFYTLLLLYGFILSAYYMPYLTAYCTKPIFIPPPDTIEEILDAKFDILTTKLDYSEIENDTDENLSRLKDLMHPVNPSVIRQYAADFNTSFAYFASEDQWEFLNRQQENLKKPHLHLTKACFKSDLRSFLMQNEGIFATEFDEFLLRVHQSGLWKQWMIKAFPRAVASGNAKILLDSYPIKPLSLEFFIIAFILLAIGLTLATVIFFIERVLWRYRLRRIVKRKV